MNPWEILGLEEGASDKEIKDAFRKLTKKCHPDKGGNPEIFAEVSKAFALIRTKDARKKFKRSKGEPEKSLTSMAIELILVKIMEGVKNTQQIHDIKYQPVLHKCENAFNEDLGQLRKNHKYSRTQIEIMTDLVSRFVYEGEDENDFIGYTLKGEVKAIKAHLKTIENQMRIAARAKKLLKLYKFNKDERESGHYEWGRPHYQIIYE